MGFNKRISYKGISQGILKGIPYNELMCFWVDYIGEGKYLFNMHELNYDLIDDVEFEDGIGGAIEIFWFEGVYDGFSVSHTTGKYNVVTIENDELTVRHFDDKTYEIISTDVIRSNIRSYSPKLFYNNTNNDEILIVVTRDNGIYDCFKTTDWLTLDRINLLTIEDLWGDYTLSTSTNVTLKEYMELGKKIIDIYESL